MPKDWARFVSETPLQTMERVLGDELTPDLAKKIHEVVAVELDKIAHKYMARNSMVAPDNVAYHLTTVSLSMHNWEARWWVRFIKPGAAEPTEMEIGSHEDARHEMLLLMHNGIPDVEVFYR